MTKDEALKLFSYKEGKLYWLIQANPRAPKGKKAGSYSGSYIVTRWQRKSWYVHRLIFLMHHGWLPVEVDHIDLDKTNNRIENLRASTSSENKFNAPIRSHNSSGIKNVSWHKRNKKWRVDIRENGAVHSIGMFDDLEFAELVAVESRAKYHGKFARHA